MRGWGWLLGLLVLSSGVEGFLFKLHDASVLDAFRRWRERPRAMVIAVIEMALLLTAAGLFASTSGWAAVAWYAAGLIVAALLLLSTHQMLRGPVSKQAGTHPQPAEAGPPPIVRQPYIWVRSRGQQLPWHSAPVTGGVPDPRAYCGYEYDRGELVKAEMPVMWFPEYNPKNQTCAACRTALAKAGYIRR